MKWVELVADRVAGERAARLVRCAWDGLMFDVLE